jgi:hypothetical protein
VAEYILFIHNDIVADDQGAWEPYLQTLKQSGLFEGGSEIGDGICVRKAGAAPPITKHSISGSLPPPSITRDRFWQVIRTSKQAGRWKYASYRGRKKTTLKG